MTYQSLVKVLSKENIIPYAETQRPKFRSDYRFEKAFNAFYKVHTAAESWPTAKIRCEGEGTELMVPETLDEADALPVLFMKIISKYEGVFLGIHDFYSDHFYVTLNGSSITNSLVDLLWGHQQPKHNASAGQGGWCAAMARSGHLYVKPCHEPLPFLCKISADTIVYKPDCDSFNLNWTRGPNDTCYMTHAEPQSWYDAYSTCLAGEGHLAVLNDRAEAEYIRNLFKQLDATQLPNKDFAFLGFSDLFKLYHFRTIHGDRIQDTGYTDWDLKCSKPSIRRVITKNSTSERCGGIRRSGLLSTSRCNVPAMFFCEKPLTSAAYTTRQGKIEEKNRFYADPFD